MRQCHLTPPSPPWPPPGVRGGQKFPKCIPSSPIMIINAKKAISGGSKILTYFFTRNIPLSTSLQKQFPYFHEAWLSAACWNDWHDAIRCRHSSPFSYKWGIDRDWYKWQIWQRNKIIISTFCTPIIMRCSIPKLNYLPVALWSY